MRRGFKLAPGEKVLIVEDVVTQGGRAQETISIARESGALVVGIAMVVDRSGGAVNLGVPQFSIVAMNVENFDPNNLPPDLAAVPPTKPGSK
jgi:orotate phosphoribosyltransferase